MKRYLLLSFLFSITAIGDPLKVLVIEPNEQLVKFLKKQKYVVEVLNVSQNQCSDNLCLPKWKGPKIEAWCSTTCSRAFRIYRFLKDKHYNIIFFPERNGYGYYITEAKKQGYGFETTTLVGYITEPTEWLWDISNISAPDIESYAKVVMEQKSIEQADIAIVPSNYAYRLLSNKGWKFPKNTKIFPPLYEQVNNNVISKSISPKKTKFKEIVFIGPCNFRKGYDLFVQTIKKAYELQPKLMESIKISVVNNLTLEDSTIIDNPLSNINYINDKNYINYIKDPSRLVLFTSRGELGSYNEYVPLYEGAHFIGMRDGFLEEIIRNENILVPSLNTSMLARKLIYTLENPEAPIPRKSLDTVKHEWNVLLKDLKPKIQKLGPSLNTPFVSVCITHFNRPTQLQDALKSFDTQTYRNFEVLVMDDGSKPEVTSFLRKEIEPFMKKRGWRIFYQNNQFISRARNNLVNYAKGPLILLFEDDDLALPDTIERFVRIKQKTQADIVNTHGGVARKNKYNISELWLAAGSYVASISGKNQMGCSAIALMSKKTFQKLGGYLDIYGFTYSDMEFYIRAALNNYKIVTSVEPTYIYNFVGQDHWGLEGSRHHTYQARHVLNAYQHALPKEFRNIPFRIHSLEKEIDEQKNKLLYDIPLWKIICFRLVKLYQNFIK